MENKIGANHESLETLKSSSLINQDQRKIKSLLKNKTVRKWGLIFLLIILLVIIQVKTYSRYIFQQEIQVEIKYRAVKIKEEEIIVSPQEWTDKVKVTIISSETLCDIQYKIGEEGEWQDYTEEGFEVTENTTVYARLVYKNTGHSDQIMSETSKKITNIDDIPPEVSLSQTRLADVVNVGDYVAYDATSGGEYKYTTDSTLTGASEKSTYNSSDSMRWKVLSVDKGSGIVELMAETPTTNEVTFYGKTGYKNAETVLNGIGAVYGHGNGAISGRSITVEDINKLEEYTPPEDSTSYTYTSGTFINSDETEIVATTNSPVTVGYTANTENRSTNRWYKYTTKNFTGEDFWIASRMIYVPSDHVTYMLRFVKSGNVANDVEGDLFESRGAQTKQSKAVLPVVTLQTNIQTTGKDESGAWTIQGKRTVKGTAKDGESGVVAYQYSKDGTLTSLSEGWTTVEKTVELEAPEYEIGDYGTYYFYAKDEAGNISKAEIKSGKLVASTKIGESITYHTSVQDAINNAGTSEATVTLLEKSTELITIDTGQNIILNLNGNILENSNGNIITNNGILTVKDDLKTGIIRSNVNDYVAILNYSQLNIIVGRLKGGIGINNVSGTCDIYGGIINGSDGHSAICNQDKLYITAGRLEGGIGINNVSGTSEIQGGIIKGTTDEGIRATAGTITIGNKDRKVNTSVPVIQGKQNGINITVGAVVNFYDGIAKGVTSAINGTVTDIEDLYEITNGTEIIDGETYKTEYLKTKEYKITYDLSGGTLSAENPTTYNVESSDITLNNPTKERYTFIGWTEQIIDFKWIKGFINYETGEILYYNEEHPNAYYTDLIYLEKGKKYTLGGYGSYSGFRYRAYDTNLQYLGNLSTTQEYTPSSNCYVRILYYETSTEEQRKGTILTSGTKDKTEIIQQGSTGNRKYTANWTANTYTITLNNQSATTAGSTAIYQKYATGIYKESSCTNAMTTAANAITKPERKYTVTYDANGGTTTTKSATATYTFGGYYTATNGSGTQMINANGFITTNFTNTKYTANATIYAKWTSGTVSANTPVRTGYTFVGWYDAATGGNLVIGAGKVYTPTANKTVYAHWTANTYVIAYNKGDATGGTLPSNQTATYGSNLTLGANNMTKSTTTNGYTITYANGTATSGTLPSKQTQTISYKANGWATSSNGAKAYESSKAFAPYNLTKGLTLYPSWTSTRNSVTLGTNSMAKSNTNLGTVTFRFNYTSGDTASTTGTGYTTYAANGWTTTNGSETRIYTNGQSITPSGNITVYPCFTQTKHSPSFPTPSRNGYKFKGWYTASVGGTKVTSYTGTSAVTYYAQWQANNYTVNYYNGDTKLGSSSHSYGTAKNLTKIADLKGSRDGYTFYGWTKATNGLTRAYTDGQSVTNLTDTAGGTITLYAIWQRDATFYSGVSKATASKVKQYYNPKGGNYTVTSPTPTAISTWTAKGWRTDTTAGDKQYNTGAAITVSNNTYYAVYARTITLEYNANGGTGTVASQTTTQKYNSNGAITTPSFKLQTNSYTRAEYVFMKWAAGSTTGTQYAEGATYTGFNPAVGSRTVKQTIYAVWQAAVARIGTKYYTTLAKAITDAGTTTSTIVMLKDVNENVTIASKQNITIDFGDSHIINSASSTNNTATITNNGTLSLKKGTVRGNAHSAIVNNGTCTVGIGGVTGSTAQPTIKNSSTGTLNITGTVTTTNNSAYAVHNSGGTVTLSGSIIGVQRCVYNESGTTNVTGGSVKSTNASGLGVNFAIEGKAGNINITGGSVLGEKGKSTSRAVALYAHDTVIVKISGSSVVKGSHTGIQASGTSSLTISGGTISAEGVIDNDDYAGVAIYASRSITMTGGTITAPAGGVGIYSCSTGNVTINSKDATISGSTGSTGIKQTGTGSITIKAGSIKCYTSAINKSSTGMVTIGENTSTLYGKTGSNILYLHSYGTTVIAESATVRYYNGTIETSSNLATNAFALSTKTQGKITAYNTAGLKVSKGDALWQYTK